MDANSPANRSTHVLRLAFAGDLDNEFVASTDIETLFTADTRTVEIDVRDVTFIDSSGLNFLLNLHKRAKTSGVSVTLVAAPDNVRRILWITGLSEHFGVEPLPL